MHMSSLLRFLLIFASTSSCRAALEQCHISPTRFSYGDDEASAAQVVKSILESAQTHDTVEWLKSIRHVLHENPELKYEEFDTSDVIRTELRALGIPFKWPLATTGIVATIGSGKPPVVALRADMDALPINALQPTMTRVWEYAGLTDCFLGSFWRHLWGIAIFRRTSFFIWMVAHRGLSVGTWATATGHDPTCRIDDPLMMLPPLDMP